jgi:transposase
MQAILNRKEKENLVIKLHQENKTIRQIAEIAHLSFGDIGKIIKRIDGRAKDEDDIDLRNKSKLTQAIYMFKCGKKPIDVAIGLDISASEIEEILQEYWVLNQLDELALLYYEIKNHLDLFLRLFHIMKKNKLINHRDIQDCD